MTDLVLRPLGVGEIIDHSLAIYRRSFAALLTITLGANALPIVVMVYVEASGGVVEHPYLYLLALLMSLVLGSLATAATVFLVSETYLGGTVTAPEAFSRAAPFVGRLILLTMMVSLVAGLTFMVFFLPGIIAGSPAMIALGMLPGMVLALMVFTGLLVATPSLVVENLAATRALNRSWHLTRGSRWKMFGLLLIIGVIIAIPVFAIVVVQGVDTYAPGAGGSSLTTVLYELAAQLAMVLIYPLLYCALTVAYYDLRVRREGFDLELLETTLAQGLPSAAGAIRELPGPTLR